MKTVVQQTNSSVLILFLEDISRLVFFLIMLFVSVIRAIFTLLSILWNLKTLSLKKSGKQNTNNLKNWHSQYQRLITKNLLKKWGIG